MSNKDVVCQRCSNNDANLRQCGRCYAVYYCSKLCQSVDWPHHKAICVDNRQSHNKNKEAGPQSYSKDMETRNLPITKEKTLKSTDMPSTHKGNGSAGKPAKPKTIGKYPCEHCRSPGASKKCARCQTVAYCSRQCQKADWTNHKCKCEQKNLKETLTLKLTEEEERIIKVHQERDLEAKVMTLYHEMSAGNFTLTKNYTAPVERFYETLSLQQALKRAKRPDGSLIKAKTLAADLYPAHDIVTELGDVPVERVDMLTFLLQRRKYILVAFMYRYQENVMRHGIYIKDAKDEESKVEFYLDQYHDDPSPFFRYSQIKPGGYICLKNPVIHHFLDRTYGFRVNNPDEVKVLEMQIDRK
ncbi:uncharacterized protein LOC123547306 isoform X2 [Mercenaria mercenaria]|nr:uncharacterized protein LOC123547306 isoform X2 [Mercenaria mercenaria]XP_045190224.2 uncharacterized protein LOC123547306 isoform X2 [Mercenaria mercenaria]XP_053407556.1 uncharacterized protein LOC123547306 isoform X2 [Mercenaria mercenaria]XP_053407557.1 uncharacterized protein LOC123547306 isoform X2 [Mercenaria mercenaria]